MASCRLRAVAAGAGRVQDRTLDLTCRMHTMMFRTLIAVLALLLALPAHAQTARAFRDKVEASMVVPGHVDSNADGGVDAWALD